MRPLKACKMPNEFHLDYVRPSEGYDWRCMRCQHEWRSRHPNEPKPRACASCRSAYWDRPPRAKKEGKQDVESKGRRKAKKHKKTVRKPKPSPSALPGVLIGESFDGGSYIPEAIIYAPTPPIAPPIAPPTQGEAAYGLTPPPHLRREYVRPSDEPAPEELIRKPKDQAAPIAPKESDWSE